MYLVCVSFEGNGQDLFHHALRKAPNIFCFISRSRAFHVRADYHAIFRWALGPLWARSHSHKLSLIIDFHREPSWPVRSSGHCTTIVDSAPAFIGGNQREQDRLKAQKKAAAAGKGKKESGTSLQKRKEAYVLVPRFITDPRSVYLFHDYF